MQTMLLATLLGLIAPTPTEGTLLFFKPNGTNSLTSSAIENQTGSRLTHVAIVLFDNGTPYVYEATTPGGVQRTPYDVFYNKFQTRRTLRPLMDLQMLVVFPGQPYNQTQLIKMKKYANAQLGRPYSVQGYLNDKKVVGMQCAQYVGNILQEAGVVKSDDYKETPISLWRKIGLHR